MKSLNEFLNEMDYKKAIDLFNKELSQLDSVAELSTKYNKTVEEIIKQLQSRLVVKRDREKNIKEVSINLLDTNTKIKVMHKMSFTNEIFTYNNSLAEGAIGRTSFKGKTAKDLEKAIKNPDPLVFAKNTYYTIDMGNMAESPLSKVVYGTDKNGKEHEINVSDIEFIEQ